ncbi:MAG: hypothetical protein ACYCTG_00520 [Ferrimicrobium sp.]
MNRLTETLELVRSQMLEVADLHLGQLFAELSDLEDIDVLSREVVAGTWLMRM